MVRVLHDRVNDRAVGGDLLALDLVCAVGQVRVLLLAAQVPGVCLQLALLVCSTGGAHREELSCPLP